MSIDNKRPVLTESQRRVSQARFEELIAQRQHELELKGQVAGPHEHEVYRGLFAIAFGAESVEIIADPIAA